MQEMQDRAIEIMGFGQALAYIKAGCKLTREGWNGKGMFVYLVPGSKFTVNRPPLNAVYAEGTEINYRSHIDLKAADGTCGVWSPSNTDLLAVDWMVVNDDQ